nr:unnamed protein product [Spirometra erinaceieuropaei]
MLRLSVKRCRRQRRRGAFARKQVEAHTHLPLRTQYCGLTAGRLCGSGGSGGGGDCFVNENMLAAFSLSGSNRRRLLQRILCLSLHRTLALLLLPLSPLSSGYSTARGLRLQPSHHNSTSDNSLPGLQHSWLYQQSLRYRSAGQAQRTNHSYKVFYLRYLTDTDVKCNDGTRAGYYLRHSKDPNSRNWMIYLEGGWYCFDEATCLARQLTNQALFSSRTWHMVRYSYYFHGSRIITAVIDELLARRDFAEAKKVVIAGSSAGGIGTMMNLDRLARKLRKRSRHRVQVSGIVDSAWFLNYPTYSQPSYLTNCTSIYDCSPEEGIHRGIELWQPRIPRRCREAEGKSKFWRCYLGPVLHQHILTPTFIIQSLFDEAQLQMNRALLLTGGSYTKFAYIQRLGQEVAKSLSVARGVFAPACSDHEILTTKQMTIESQSLHETLQEWDAQLERQQQRPLYPQAPIWRRRNRNRSESRLVYNSSMLFLSKLVAVLNKPKVDGTQMRGGQYARVSRDLNGLGDRNQSNVSDHYHAPWQQTRPVKPFIRTSSSSPTPRPTVRLIDKCSLESGPDAEGQNTVSKSVGTADTCRGRAMVTPMCNPSCRSLTHPRTMEKLNIVSLLELYGVDTFQLAANAGFSVRELKSLPVKEQMRAIYCPKARR